MRNHAIQGMPGKHALVAAILSGPFLCPAFGLPAGFTKTIVADSVNPVMLAVAPDGRVFFTEKHGEIRLIKNDKLLPAPFVDIGSRVIHNETCCDERGLLGIELDPEFTENHYVYAFYNDRDHAAKVVRFTAAGDVAAPGSEQLIFNAGTHTGTWHHGGDLKFGPDGKLWITRGNAQDVARSGNNTDVFGTLLRINGDGTIPEDNPWYVQNQGDARAAWAYGLRNPVTIEWQPGTDLMYISDVQDRGSDDEIDEGNATSGYGYGGGGDTGPIYQWGVGGFALMGGLFYDRRSPQHRLSFPDEYHGLYFFGNAGGGSPQIRTLDPDSKNVEVFETNQCITDADLDRQGSIYFAARCGNGSAVTDGRILKVSFPEGTTPLIPLPSRAERAMAEAVSWRSVDGGLWITSKLGIDQTLDLRTLEGGLVTSARFKSGETLRFEAPRGLYLLMWQPARGRTVPVKVLVN